MSRLECAAMRCNAMTTKAADWTTRARGRVGWSGWVAPARWSMDADARAAAQPSPSDQVGRRWYAHRHRHRVPLAVARRGVAKAPTDVTVASSPPAWIPRPVGNPRSWAASDGRRDTMAQPLRPHSLPDDRSQHVRTYVSGLDVYGRRRRR
jgi:hypothetical protein